MNYSNLYATLAEFQGWLTQRGQTINTDANDDGVMQSILQRASRYADRITLRSFYPRYETQLFDVPQGGSLAYGSQYSQPSMSYLGNVQRTLLLHDDLLELITLTNGDATVIPSTAYLMLPANDYPKYCVEIIQSATSYYWKPDNNNNFEQVISVLGVFGYRSKYTQRGWSQADTLAAAITDTTSLTFTTTSNNSVVQNQIVKIDTELFNVTSVATNTSVTVNLRGDNGSTAATHLINAPIYVWNPQDEIKDAVLQIAESVYSSRSGQVSSGKVTVTAAGVVIRPENVPAMAQDILNQLMKTSSG